MPELQSDQVLGLDPSRVQSIVPAQSVDQSPPPESTLQYPPQPSPAVSHDEVTCATPVIEVDDHQTELAAVGKVLGLLEQQLISINRDVENSVVGICSGFNGMAQRAQAAVAAAQNVSAQNAIAQNAEPPNAAALNATSKKKANRNADASIASAEDPIVEMQKVLEALLINVQASCQFSQNAAAKLLHLEQRLASVEKIVAEVEDIAGRAKMVALNGRIEAARLGEAGKAFGVVAQETKDLADKAAQTSQSIRQSITKLATELASTTADMQLRAESDTVGFQQTNAVASELLTKLDAAHRRMSESIDNTFKINVALQGDIAKAVMSLQFQDRVSQCVFHVIETLSGLVDRIDPWCSNANPIETQQHFESWQREMEARYTMDSERAANTETYKTPQSNKTPSGSKLVGKSQPDQVQPVVHSVELF